MTARRKRVGSGNYVQPHEHGELYDVMVGWERIELASTHLEAVSRLHKLVDQDKPIIRINGR